MKDHPIPQDVTGYKFHIVGNMTLKQFGIIVFGVIVAFVIYQLKLPALIAWPFIILFGGGGLVAAFVPIEERPLDHWILTFLRTLYRPTQFFWKRSATVPEVFKFEPSNAQFVAPPTDLAPAKRARIHDYLNSLHTQDQLNQEDVAEAQQIAGVLSHFSSVAVTPPVSSSSTPATEEPHAPEPSMVVKVRPIAPAKEEKGTIFQASNARSETTQPITLPLPTPTFAKPITVLPNPIQPTQAQSTINETTPIQPQPIKVPPTQPVAAQPIQAEPSRTIAQAAGSVLLPSQTNIDVGNDSDVGASQNDEFPTISSKRPFVSPLPNPLANLAGTNTLTAQPSSSTTPTSPTLTSRTEASQLTTAQTLPAQALPTQAPAQTPVSVQSAQQPADLPFPSPPAEPNTLVGMVVNQNNELLPNALIEVSTASGQVVRVVRTNALGQFFVTTPLPSGSYILQAEQENLKFIPQQLEVGGGIIAPLLFRATA